MISVGAVKFAALPGSLREWAGWLTVSVQAVSTWRTGDRTPNAAARMKIADVAKERYGAEIGEELWDQRITEEIAQELKQAAIPPRPAGSGAPPGPLREATPEDTAQLTAQLLAHIRDLQTELSDPASVAGYNLQERIAMGDKLAGAVDRLGKLTGVKLSERQILASPIFHDLLERIMAALAEWPDAMRAVGKALQPVEKDPKA